jgi:short-subunit dehydrogenase
MCAVDGFLVMNFRKRSRGPLGHVERKGEGMAILPKSESPVAVITGASSGIGKALALELTARCYRLTLGARRMDKLQDVADQCRKLGGEVLAVATDVTVQAQVEALVKAATDAFGRLDVMVNNAGKGLFSRVQETTPQQMRDIFDVNFLGVFHGCLAAIPVMIAQRSGHIMNVASVVGKRGTPYHGAYSATKFAVIGLTESMRVELKPRGIKVTAVCPALTDTEFFESSARGVAAKQSFAKLRRMMPAEEVAKGMADAIGKNRPEIVFTFGGKLLAVMSALFPRAADAMMARYFADITQRIERST